MGYLSESKVMVAFGKGKLSGKTFTGIVRYYAKEGLDKRIVESVIDALVDKGKLIKRDGKFYLASYGKSGKAAKPVKPQRLTTLTGVFRCVEKGYGFVTVADDKDYFIRSENMGQALNGDTVVIRPIEGGAGDLAEIVNVEKRGVTKTVGALFSEGGLYYVRPDDKAYFADIFVNNAENIPAGEKVLVEIRRFPKNRCPEGVIVKRIGKQYEFETEELSLIYSAGVPTEFSNEVIAEAKEKGEFVKQSDIVGRRDLRGKLIFTIDGETARDFDDAVSLDIDNGVYVLGVHIADVTHYVEKDGALDKSAFERGTSIYLPDRVIPMLPFELSNGICSLNEGVDRLTLTAEMRFDENGKMLSADIFKSVIRSTHRLTYTIVQAMIDGDDGAKEKYPDVCETILKMNDLRAILEKRRIKQGYVDLNIKESEVYAGENGIEVGVHTSNLATKLIEQFMISANEAVANYLFNRHLPCVYRVHEPPLPEKSEQLALFLRALGIRFVSEEKLSAKDIQKLLSSTADSRYAAVVNRMVLRSMQKAKYSSTNVGHFGLASECYCHFTSPIRRYPDVAVHRVLKLALDGQLSSIIDLYEGFCTSVGEKASATERVADELERSVDDLYKTQYMSDKIGQEFFGVISGVLSVGFFVELENTCEGFVPIELLPAGTYTYDKESMCLSTHRRTYKLGDRVKICVLSADISSRRIDFCLAK